jgi:hypothetical protein
MGHLHVLDCSPDVTHILMLCNPGEMEAAETTRLGRQ